LISSTSSLTYNPPTQLLSEALHTTLPVSPKHKAAESTSPAGSLRLMKRTSSENLYCPRDEIEEAVILLLLTESILCSDREVNQTKEGLDEKQKISNEARSIFNLLVLALTRRQQYTVLTQAFERNMKLAFEEFHIWFQFALTLVSDGKYVRSMLIFEQCHKLQPGNVEVLMFMAKLSINNLQQFRKAIEYGEKIIAVTKNEYMEANARLIVGLAYSHLSTKANSTDESKSMLKYAVASLQRAHSLDENDVEILFHLSYSLALSKQVNLAVTTIQKALSINPFDLLSLHLLVLLLSAQKKYHDALEVLEAAIREYPTDFNLLLMRIRLKGECYGAQASLTHCHGMLIQWNDLFNMQDGFVE